MKNVLVVEDEAAISMLLGMHFEEHGFSVVQAGDSDQAITALDTLRPNLTVTDWSIGGSSTAKEIIHKSREKNPACKIAIITGYNIEQIEGELEDMKPFEYFTKPVDFEVMVAQLVKGID